MCMEGGDPSAFPTDSESDLTQLQSRRYDPIRDIFKEAEPSSSRPPVQQNVEPVQASGSEQQNIQSGEGSTSSNLQLNIPIDQNQLTEEHKEFARTYKDVYSERHASIIRSHRGK